MAIVRNERQANKELNQTYRRVMVRRPRPCIAALILGMFILASAPATAGNFSGATGNYGCSGGVNMADNRTHYFWYDSLTTDVRGPQNWTRTNNYDPTDINTVDDTSENSLTDAIVRDQDYTTYCGYDWHDDGDPGLLGLYSCNTLNTNGECESAVLRYDISYMDSASDSARRGLACHETGHSLGLTHRDTGDGCMKNPAPSNPWLTDHDRTHLNGEY